MPAENPPPIALALQGGGAHGAFTWGALDRLLEAAESGAFRIAAISGASAGALNGAALALGLGQSPAEARRLLAQFWECVAKEGNWAWNPFGMLGRFIAPGWNIDETPLAIGLDFYARFVSPYHRPFYTNALARVIDRALPNLGDLKGDNPNFPALFISATEVTRSERRIFERHAIDTDRLLASACLPNYFQAVQIGEDYFWDGGYMGNPALKPLLGLCADIVMIGVDPLQRADGPPRSATAILDRLNEISFNATWLLELKTIDLINQLLREGKLAKDSYREIRFHRIADEPFMAKLGLHSKLNSNWEFLSWLRDAGRKAADGWLSENLHCIGRISSCDVREELLAAKLKD